jgi:putative endonuclease
VFLEVKTRRKQKFGEPSETVKEAKRQRQITIARQFMSICRITNVQVRFDIISIFWPTDAPPSIQHIENAFSVSTEEM